LKKIKIRKFTKSRFYLYTTLSVLSIITIYTLITMDFDNVNIAKATVHFFKDLKTMFFSPRLSDRYTYSQVFLSLSVTIALAVLTTIIGSFIALFFSFFAAKNLSSSYISKAVKIGITFIRAIPTILWVMVFSVVANIMPKEMKELIEAFLKQEYEKAYKLHTELYDVSRNMFIEGNPVTVKTAMKILGKIDNDIVRLPLVSCEEKTADKLTKMFKQKGIIK